jgi:hypothetical protein
MASEWVKRRVLPVPGELAHERGLERPRVGVTPVPAPRLADALQGDHHLAEHVVLTLVDSGVADAHRP